MIGTEAAATTMMVKPKAVAWLASYFPSRRAATIDPVEALRAE